jgi:hypothetical protein
MDAPDDALALKVRADTATAALRSVTDSGELDSAPAWLRDKISRAAIALATIGNADDGESVIVAGERALESARAWLTERARSGNRRRFEDDR